MLHYVGLDVSQKMTAICVVDEQGQRLWRGECVTDPGAISDRVLKHAGIEAKVGVETGSMTPWLVHGLRSAGLDVQCLDARRVKAALQMRLNKTDENDAEGLSREKTPKRSARCRPGTGGAGRRRAGAGSVYRDDRRDPGGG